MLIGVNFVFYPLTLAKRDGGGGDESFFTLIEIFLSVYNEFLLINDDLSHRCGQKGGNDCGDVSPMPLGSKESHDPPYIKHISQICVIQI